MHIHRKRSPLGNLGITLLPDQIAIPSAFQAFGPEGHLVDPKQEAKVKALGATLVENLKYAWDLWRKAVLLLACSSYCLPIAPDQASLDLLIQGLLGHCLE